MTEQELIDSGFTKVYIPIEESGDKTNYWYYTYDLSDNITLISSDSDSSKENWSVMLFEDDIEINDINDIRNLIDIFGKYKNKLP
jgi:hypothetical protein